MSRLMWRCKVRKEWYTVGCKLRMQPTRAEGKEGRGHPWTVRLEKLVYLEGDWLAEHQKKKEAERAVAWPVLHGVVRYLRPARGREEGDFVAQKWTATVPAHRFMDLLPDTAIVLEEWDDNLFPYTEPRIPPPVPTDGPNVDRMYLGLYVDAFADRLQSSTAVVVNAFGLDVVAVAGLESNANDDAGRTSPAGVW